MAQKKSLFKIKKGDIKKPSDVVEVIYDAIDNEVTIKTAMATADSDEEQDKIFNKRLKKKGATRLISDDDVVDVKNWGKIKIHKNKGDGKMSKKQLSAREIVAKAVGSSSKPSDKKKDDKKVDGKKKKNKKKNKEWKFQISKATAEKLSHMPKDGKFKRFLKAINPVEWYKAIKRKLRKRAERKAEENGTPWLTTWRVKLATWRLNRMFNSPKVQADILRAEKDLKKGKLVLS